MNTLIGKKSMTEAVITTCIAPNCEREVALNSALCSRHKEELQRTENAILTDATRTIRADMRQFERLSLVEPQLHSAEIAFRMAEPIRRVRQWLKKFRDDRA